MVDTVGGVHGALEPPPSTSPHRHRPPRPPPPPEVDNSWWTTSRRGPLGCAKRRLIYQSVPLQEAGVGAVSLLNTPREAFLSPTRRVWGGGDCEERGAGLKSLVRGRKRGRPHPTALRITIGSIQRSLDVETPGEMRGGPWAPLWDESGCTRVCGARSN